MKSKTLWYICLALILFGSFLIGSQSTVTGVLILGSSAYVAGAYHIKWRLEKDNNEYDKLIGGKNEKKKS